MPTAKTLWLTCSKPRGVQATRAPNITTTNNACKTCCTGRADIWLAQGHLTNQCNKDTHANLDMAPRAGRRQSHVDGATKTPVLPSTTTRHYAASRTKFNSELHSCTTEAMTVIGHSRRLHPTKRRQDDRQAGKHNTTKNEIYLR